MITMYGSLVYLDGMKQIELGEMDMPELIELLHRVADEIQLREMEKAE